jgi:predicted transglutaminase-like cysteine proteinase
MARSETGGMDLNSYREDFALELRARLEARIAPGALRLVQCWTERGTAHLVLALDTTNRGTLIADNRRPLQHWTSLNYRFLGGVTEVPGRQLWAWNIRAPSLATTLADLLKPRGES